MEVRFTLPDLRKLDDLRGEALALALFSDERPLRGALGLVDWRMAGFLSRQILRGHLSGHVGEVLLMPTAQRLPFDKLFVFGLGASADFDAAGYDAAVDRILRTLSRARVRASVCGLPGRSMLRIEAEEGISRFLEASRGFDELDEITLIESAAAQREMEPIVSRVRRRDRASDAG